MLYDNYIGSSFLAEGQENDVLSAGTSLLDPWPRISIRVAPFRPRIDKHLHGHMS